MNHSSAITRTEIDAALGYFRRLQDRICDGLQAVDGEAKIREDTWQHVGENSDGGGGRSRVLENGKVFEKGGINFSHVKGSGLPTSASAGREQLAGLPYEAMGVSLVMHPENPFIPTVHANVRLFVADPDGDVPIWWFGGGYDLTPYYGFVEDCQHWHRVAKTACDGFGDDYYVRFKGWCDRYFYVKHRQEPRGIGRIIFR